MGVTADDLTAIGTVGAFAVSLFLLGRDQVYRTEAARQAKGEQFRQFSAWVDIAGGNGNDSGMHWQGAVTVANVSTEPIYDCVVTGIAIFDGYPDQVQVAESVDVPPVGPKVIQQIGVTVPRGTNADGAPKWRTVIEARDAAGRKWRRERDGRVTLLEDVETSRLYRWLRL